MYAIKMLFHIDAPLGDVFNALSSIDGLSGWWTVHTSGSTELNGVIEFDFPPSFHNKMKVVGVQKDEYVRWNCIEGAADWVGTEISFVMDRNEGKTRVRFEHSGWEHQEDFFARCSYGWGAYLSSLNRYVEAGEGDPYSVGISEK